MILPSPAERETIKADARRRFRSDRCAQIALTAPIDACVVVSPFALAGYIEHVDARAQGHVAAQACAVVDRLLWCSPTTEGPGVDVLVATPEDLDPLRRVALERSAKLRATWPALDNEIERELRKIAGAPVGEIVHATRLTAGTLPPGLSAAEGQRLLADAPTTGPGSLWGVRGNGGLSLVLRAPLADVYLAARAAWQRAHSSNVGIVEAHLVYVRQLVAWSPEPFDTYLEAHPGFAEGLWSPLFEMGGSAAEASTTFL